VLEINVAALSNFGWVREYIALRIFGLIIFCAGLLLYGLMAWIFYIEVTRINYTGWPEFVLSFLQYAVFAPGLVPLIIGLRFLLLFRSPNEFAKGIVIFIPLFIVVHYIVAAVSAHDSGWPYIGFQLVEILLAGVVLFKYKKR
jgi:hypothetical protein